MVINVKSLLYVRGEGWAIIMVNSKNQNNFSLNIKIGAWKSSFLEKLGSGVKNSLFFVGSRKKEDEFPHKTISIIKLLVSSYLRFCKRYFWNNSGIFRREVPSKTNYIT